MKSMENAYTNLKARYEKFLKNGSEDPLTLKADAERLLAEAKAKGNHNLVQELEEILIDLSFSVEETKCHCYISSKCRC